MTTVAVLADPPEQSSAFAGLVDEGVLAAEDASMLYTAAVCDACRAVERSGGDLLVNFRTYDESQEAAREAVESAVAPALSSPEDARFEVQVGSSRSARVGNTVTHLLKTEESRSVAVLDPVVALLERRHIDSAAMKLRQSEVVLGPSPGGRVWYAGFTEPIDFTDALEAPALRTLTECSRSEEYDVDFMEQLPVLGDRANLASAMVQIRAREQAEKYVPPYVSAVLDDLDLEPVVTDDGLTIERTV